MIPSIKQQKACLAAMAVLAMLFGITRSATAQATGTIVGTVKDAQGGVIPGATVSIVSEGRGTTIDTVTNSTGDFVMSNIPGDLYTVKVALSGFKTTERSGVRVSPGDRVSLGTMTLEQGGLAETVVVSTEAVPEALENIYPAPQLVAELKGK